MQLHRKIIAQTHSAVLEFWTSFLIFLILLSGTLFLWLISFGGGTHEADEISIVLLFGGIGFDILIFWLLFTLAASRKRMTKELADIEKRLATHHKADIRLIDHTKDEFVALASHQLRTPLSTINWYAELLLDDTTPPLDRTQKKYVTHIQESCTRLIHLVNAILNISRIELNTFSIKPEKCALLPLIKDVVSENESLVAEKKLKIHIDISTSAHSLIADKKLLCIILENLISNAVRYTPPHGKITIAAHADKDAVTIRVTDTGYGIPARQQGKIFSKLFRADNIRQHDTTGSGLGLHIVKTIIDHIDGRIWFESKENIGSTFFISLPKQSTKHRSGISIYS